MMRASGEQNEPTELCARIAGRDFWGQYLVQPPLQSAGGKKKEYLGIIITAENLAREPKNSTASPHQVRL